MMLVISIIYSVEFYGAVFLFAWSLQFDQSSIWWYLMDNKQ